MKTCSIKEILQGKFKVNSKVEIMGWVKNKRSSKIGISFIDINDGSCLKSLQIVANNKLKNYKQEIRKLTAGCSIEVYGLLTTSFGINQYYEIKVLNLKVLGWISCPEKYPISSKYHSMEFLRENSHLRPRTNIIGSVSRIRNTLMFYIHEFMNKNGFFWIPTPIITSSDTEGNSKMFRISNMTNDCTFDNKKFNFYKNSFFGKEAFLTVSGQLNLESYSCALSKVYTFGPVFRAENSNTNKHLSEFWMVEPEISFANLNDIIKFSVKMLKYLIEVLLEKCVEEINFLQKLNNTNLIKKLEKFIKTELVQLEYSEVIKILNNYSSHFKNSINWGMDISTEHEKFLIDKYFLSSIIVKNYPKDIKAFYMRLNSDSKTVASMDILLPKVGEIIGGSQREERLDVLDISLKQKISSDKIKNYWWYRDLRKYGTVPHSGFGLGFERLILFLTDINNIRDVVPFPRTPDNVKF